MKGVTRKRGVASPSESVADFLRIVRHPVSQRKRAAMPTPKIMNPTGGTSSTIVLRELSGDEPVIRFWETQWGQRFYTCLQRVKARWKKRLMCPNSLRPRQQKSPGICPEPPSPLKNCVANAASTIRSSVSYGDEKLLRGDVVRIEF